MNDTVGWKGADAPQATSGFGPALASKAGLVVLAPAMLVAAALAILFAATLALVALLASLLMALAVLAWQVRPRTAQAVIRTRGGHAWVAYSWDRTGR